MVPAAFVRLEALPLMPNGKVDRKALPAPEAVVGRVGYVAPRAGDGGACLRASGARCSEPSGSARHDHFFELGGHSLLATQVVSRLRSAFGVELPLREAVRGADAGGAGARDRGSAGVGRDGGTTAGGAAAAGVAAALVRAAAAVVPRSAGAGQRGLQHAGGAAAARALDVDGAAAHARDAGRAARGAAHDASCRRRRAVQQIASRRPGGRCRAFEVVAARRRRRLGARAEAARPFDLASGPLAADDAVARWATSEHVLLVTMHHIVSDGWSLGVLVRELMALYRGASRRARCRRWRRCAVQYADYALWQRNGCTGEVLDEQLGYWRERLAGAPPLELPTDRPRPAVPVIAARRMRSCCRRRSPGELRRVGREQGATLFMTLLAAFEALLHRLHGAARRRDRHADRQPHATRSWRR